MTDLTVNKLKSKIYLIRKTQVMLDRDLAKLYCVETRRLNEQVKRNLERFPESFMFQLTDSELKDWISQNATSNSEVMGLRKNPFAFTEQGVSMLSAVLKSKTAIDVSIKIIDAFVNMRKYFSENKDFLLKFQQIDQKFIEFDDNFNKIFRAIENNSLPSKGIFYDGQVFQSHKFILDLLKTAKTSVILIDNYIDETVLNLFSNLNLKVKIYTKNISKKLSLSVDKFNSEFDNEIEILEFNKSHDRYLIIDKKVLYHFGASLKDLGKKWFSFQKLDTVKDMLEKLD